MTNISKTAESLIASIKSCKGHYIRAKFTSNVTPAAAHKEKQLSKITTGRFRSGIDYANLKSVQDGIASGERGEVEPLPWGEWALFPWIILHKGVEYLRLYPVQDAAMDVLYVVDGANVTKEQFQELLTPSQRAEKPAPACITKRLAEVEFIGCWENPELEEHDCCE